MKSNGKGIVLILLIGIISLIGLSGSYSERSPKSKQADQIVGIWTEYWEGEDDDSETDVTCVDTLKISINDLGNLSMECLNNSQLLYDRISFKKDKLTFRMENISDPSEQFFVYYKLSKAENEGIFAGSIVNSKKQKARVKLIRLRSYGF
jgi:hypothetical protein